MVEAGGASRLLQNPARALLVLWRVGLERLDRDLAPQPEIARPIDDAHATGTERADDFVIAEPLSGRQRRGHHPSDVCAADNG